MLTTSISTHLSVICQFLHICHLSHMSFVLCLFYFRYIINYSPFDIVYKLCKFLPVRVIIYCAMQIQMVSRVHHGVTYALKKFPGSFVIACLIGIAKGNLIQSYMYSYNCDFFDVNMKICTCAHTQAHAHRMCVYR